MEALKIKFDGLPGMIEANTFINSLLHFTTIVQETSKEIDPAKKVQVNIVANKEGSFLVDIAIVASNLLEQAKGLFSKDNAEYAANLAATVGAVYGVAKFLRGAKPKSIESTSEGVTVTAPNGNVTVFDFRGARGVNIYANNPTVREAVSQEMDTLSADENVTGFELQDDKGNPMVALDRKEIQGIAEAEPGAPAERGERIITRRANLYIVSLDWDLKRKWTFINRGYTITARIKDDAWAETIDKGERFGKGDMLQVEMDIHQVYDETLDTWVNKGYTVTRIIQHVEKAQQSVLGLTSDDRVIIPEWVSSEDRVNIPEVPMRNTIGSGYGPKQLPPHETEANDENAENAPPTV